MRNRRFKVVLVVVLAAAVSPFGAVACTWDRDTLAMEARGLPDVVNVITGRFERQPAQYFEMRLSRVTAAIANGSESLEDFDDAGVAADRLKKGDLALDLMRRKKLLLDKLGTDNPKASEHLYRYHANTGTFYAHRWLRAGALRDRLADLEQARSHIARAIEINADAHFGRERYQLMAVEWLLAAPKIVNSVDDTLFWPLRDRIGESYPGAPGTLGRAGIKDAIEGLSGLIVLGDAWESVDVFLALAMALEGRGHAGLALLAKLRVGELLADGRHSLHPDATEQSVRDKMAWLGMYHLDKVRSEEFFAQARKYAADWQAHRTAFMSARFQTGLHPDTHAEFWEGYVELPGAPELPDTPLWERPYANFLIVSGIVFVAGVFVLWLWRRAHKRKLLASTRSTTS